MEQKIAIFKDKKVRKTLHNGEWWFSVIDVIEALTDSTQPSKYWTAMKARVESEGQFQLSTICRQLKLEATDGKKYETDCANTEDIFRIIQSIPSPPKQSHSNAGWQKSVTNGFKKSKILNLQPNVLAPCIN